MNFPKRNVLYAVTDRRGLDMPLEKAVELALAGGVNVIQLREKNTDFTEFLALAEKLRKVTSAYGVPLIINDNVDIAIASGADGVHLGQGDGDVREARDRLGGDKIIGVSARTVEQALFAKENGADYLGVGAAFSTSTKADAKHIERAMYRKIRDAVDIPIVAIGGITAENIHGLEGLGIDGAAVVSAIFSAKDIKKAAQELAAAVKKL